MGNVSLWKVSEVNFPEISNSNGRCVSENGTAATNTKSNFSRFHVLDPQMGQSGQIGGLVLVSFENHNNFPNSFPLK